MNKDFIKNEYLIINNNWSNYYKNETEKLKKEIIKVNRELNYFKKWPIMIGTLLL